MNEWTLTPEQMRFMSQIHELIEAAQQNDNAFHLLQQIAESEKFAVLFGKMGFDEASDRYLTTLEEVSIMTKQDVLLKIKEYETQFNLSSVEFLQKWHSGAVRDCYETNDWAILLDMFNYIPGVTSIDTTVMDIQSMLDKVNGSIVFESQNGVLTRIKHMGGKWVFLYVSRLDSLSEKTTIKLVKDMLYFDASDCIYRLVACSPTKDILLLEHVEFD